MLLLKKINVTALLIFTFILIVAGFVLISCIQSIHKMTQEQLKEQINWIWKEAVSTDCSQRLAETGSGFFDFSSQRVPSPAVTIRNPDTTIVLNRKDLPVPKDNSDRTNRALQTILVDENPVRPTQLDSLFRSLLEKKQIQVSTAVSYFYNSPGNRIQYSISDTTFLQSAFATQEIKTGIDNSIILRGYAKISFLQNIRYAKDLYAGWLVLTIGVLFLLFFLWRKRKVILILDVETAEEKEEKEEENGTSTPVGQCKEIIFIRHKSEIRFDDRTIELTNLECLLFCLLIQGENYSVSYEMLMNRMWPNGDGEKKKLEQQCRNLRIKLEQIPAIQVKANRGSGYYLAIDEEFTICNE